MISVILSITGTGQTGRSYFVSNLLIMCDIRSVPYVNQSAIPAQLLLSESLRRPNWWCCRFTAHRPSRPAGVTDDVIEGC